MHCLRRDASVFLVINFIYRPGQRRLLRRKAEAPTRMLTNCHCLAWEQTLQHRADRHLTDFAVTLHDNNEFANHSRGLTLLNTALASLLILSHRHTVGDAQSNKTTARQTSLMTVEPLNTDDINCARILPLCAKIK